MLDQINGARRGFQPRYAPILPFVLSLIPSHTRKKTPRGRPLFGCAIYWGSINIRIYTEIVYPLITGGSG